ncbi:MAG: hypothetical protein GXP56_03755 [Deltaproteobacteria bacterium]|nr:hypothetical protein [Deltaproteobacteria bacterium]
MRNKHQGLFCLSIFFLTFLGVLVHGFYIADRMVGKIRVARQIPVPDIKVPDQSTVAYIDFLTSRLDDLAKLKDTDLNVDLSLFGFLPSLPGKINKTGPGSLKNTHASFADNEKNVGFSYALTLSFASLKNRACVIGGKIYKENGKLPDGGKILKIENDRVLILKNNKKKWIYLFEYRKKSQEKNEEAI